MLRKLFLTFRGACSVSHLADKVPLVRAWPVDHRSRPDPAAVIRVVGRVVGAAVPPDHAGVVDVGSVLVLPLTVVVTVEKKKETS